jgi:hypothetical protein
VSVNDGYFGPQSRSGVAQDLIASFFADSIIDVDAAANRVFFAAIRNTLSSFQRATNITARAMRPRAADMNEMAIATGANPRSRVTYTGSSRAVACTRLAVSAACRVTFGMSLRSALRKEPLFGIALVRDRDRPQAVGLVPAGAGPRRLSSTILALSWS